MKSLTLLLPFTAYHSSVEQAHGIKDALQSSKTHLWIHFLRRQVKLGLLKPLKLGLTVVIFYPNVSCVERRCEISKDFRRYRCLYRQKMPRELFPRILVSEA